MVQILGKSIANPAVPIPFGHTFCYSSDYTRAPVAQRNHRKHFAGNDYWRSTVGGLAGHLDLVVQLLIAGEFGLHIDLYDIEKGAALARNETARALAAVAIHSNRRHRTEILVEVHRKPSIELRRLPVTRSPAVIAQTERVDFELAVVAVGGQHEFSGGMAKLFQVALCELSFGVTGLFRRDPLSSILFAQLASPTRRGRDVVNFERRLRVGISLERLGWIGHLERVFQNA